MDWEATLLDLLLLAYVVVLPASIWGHLLYPRERLAVTFSLGLVLMLATVPLSVAIVSGIAGVAPGAGLVTIISTVATLVGLTASLARMRSRTRGLEE